MHGDKKVYSGLTAQLAGFSASLTYEDLPSHVVTTVKQILLDSLGCSLAATTLGEGCQEALAVMRDLGGKPQSTLLGYAHKISAPHAAFANGALAHALNFDSLGPETGHVGVVTLAAALAVAEAVGGVSGRRFLAAAAVAAEVTSRVSAAQARTGHVSSDRFLAGQLFGYFGAAAGAGHILGLTPAQMHSAFGLALMQSAGSMQVVLGGDPPAKAIYGAFPNHGGVLAALLAKQGLGAECDALEGRAGLYAMAYGGEYDASVLTQGLRADFLLTGTQFKAWPTSAVVHPFIEAASRAAQGLSPAQIKSVQIIGHGHIQPWCEPLEKRRRPHNGAAAANSVPFAVAKALVHGDVSLGDFTPEGINDEAALQMADRTTYLLDDRVEGGMVRIALIEGREREAHVVQPLGHPSRPMPHDRLTAKFRDCCSYSQNPLAPATVDRLIDYVANLEQAGDISELARLAGGN